MLHLRRVATALPGSALAVLATHTTRAAAISSHRGYSLTILPR